VIISFTTAGLDQQHGCKTAVSCMADSSNTHQSKLLAFNYLADVRCRCWGIIVSHLAVLSLLCCLLAFGKPVRPPWNAPLAVLSFVALSPSLWQARAPAVERPRCAFGGLVFCCAAFVFVLQMTASKQMTSFLQRISAATYQLALALYILQRWQC